MKNKTIFLKIINDDILIVDYSKTLGNFFKSDRKSIVIETHKKDCEFVLDFFYQFINEHKKYLNNHHISLFNIESKDVHLMSYYQTINGDILFIDYREINNDKAVDYLQDYLHTNENDLYIKNNQYFIHDDVDLLSFAIEHPHLEMVRISYAINDYLNEIKLLSQTLYEKEFKLYDKIINKGLLTTIDKIRLRNSYFALANMGYSREVIFISTIVGVDESSNDYCVQLYDY